MGIFNTRPRFDDVQIKQLSGDTITLSGTTNISGTFRYLPGATTGYVLKAIDSSGTVGWQPVSVSADTNTFVTGGTLSGNNLILGWNTGGSASAIDLSALSDSTYWTAGTSGTGSIRVVNGGTTDATGNYSVAAGFNNIVSGEDSFIHSKDSLITGDRSVLLGGQSLTGTTDDTVYVPNLTTRGNHILHSDSTLEVSDIPGTLENIIKGSYTEFNWDGLTTSVLSNNNPSGYTSVILGNLTTYPTREDYGFLSYYGSGYTRTGSPGTGIDFYRDRLVLKSSSNSDGVIFSNNGPKKFWWEIDSKSRMILDDQGQLGLGLNVDGSQNPSEMLHIDGGNLLVRDSQGIFITDIENSAGPLVKLTGGTTDLSRFSVSTPTFGGISIGVRGASAGFPGYGKQGDSFIYSSNENNGFNIVSEPGSGTDDYIRFFAGQAGGAANTPDLYIQGSGTTGSVVRGNIGINNDTPTSKLDIIGTNGYNQLRLRTNYTPTSTADTNGAVGDIAWDNNYLYIKTGTGWGRLSLDYAF